MVEDIDATIDEIADEAGTGKAAYSFKYAAAEMLLKARNERDAYIRETGKYARECGLQDAEIGRLKERAEKAERERDALYQEWISQPKPGAERKRFELLVPLRVHMISNRVPAITTPNKSLYDAPISGM